MQKEGWQQKREFHLHLPHSHSSLLNRKQGSVVNTSANTSSPYSVSNNQPLTLQLPEHGVWNTSLNGLPEIHSESNDSNIMDLKVCWIIALGQFMLSCNDNLVLTNRDCSRGRSAAINKDFSLPPACRAVYLLIIVINIRGTTRSKGTNAARSIQIPSKAA